MAEIHIVRAHSMGLVDARRLARRWAEVARDKLGVQCVYQQGEDGDLVRFSRPGARGALKVGPQGFALDARLGLLLGVLRHRIEGEIVGRLDELLAHEDPLRAFEEGLAQHEQQHGKHPLHRRPRGGGGPGH